MQHILEVNVEYKAEREGLVGDFCIFFDFKNNSYFL